MYAGRGRYEWSINRNPALPQRYPEACGTAALTKILGTSLQGVQRRESVRCVVPRLN